MSEVGGKVSPSELSGDLITQERVEAFLRLLVHDVRNDLNAIELLTAYIQDITQEPEVLEELKHVRAAAQYAAKRMISISKALQKPEATCSAYGWNAFREDLEVALKNEDSIDLGRLQWEGGKEECEVCVDGALIFTALAELIRNALAFSDVDFPVLLRFSVEAKVCRVVIEQYSPELTGDAPRWGVGPFESTRRGHYGLGLFRVRGNLAAQNAELSFMRIGGGARWVTEVRLPRWEAV